MFRCGFVRMNWLLAMVSSLDARNGKAFSGTRGGRQPARARTAQGTATLPRVLLRVGKGQLRISAPPKVAHAAATEAGNWGANMAVTVAETPPRSNVFPR